MRAWIIALSLVGCAARIPVEPAPRKEIVAKRERLVVAFGRPTALGDHEVDRYWLVAADGSVCTVGWGMWRATHVGQVLACPYAWRTTAVLREE